MPTVELSQEELRLLIVQWKLTKEKHQIIKIYKTNKDTREQCIMGYNIKILEDNPAPSRAKANSTPVHDESDGDRNKSAQSRGGENKLKPSQPIGALSKKVQNQSSSKEHKEKATSPIPNAESQQKANLNSSGSKAPPSEFSFKKTTGPSSGAQSLQKSFPPPVVMGNIPMRLPVVPAGELKKPSPLRRTLPPTPQKTKQIKKNVQKAVKEELVLKINQNSQSIRIPGTPAQLPPSTSSQHPIAQPNQTAEENSRSLTISDNSSRNSISPSDIESNTQEQSSPIPPHQSPQASMIQPQPSRPVPEPISDPVPPPLINAPNNELVPNQATQDNQVGQIQDERPVNHEEEENYVIQKLRATSMLFDKSETEVARLWLEMEDFNAVLKKAAIEYLILGPSSK